MRQLKNRIDESGIETFLSYFLIHVFQSSVLNSLVL